MNDIKCMHEWNSLEFYIYIYILVIFACVCLCMQYILFAGVHSGSLRPKYPDPSSVP